MQPRVTSGFQLPAGQAYRTLPGGDHDVDETPDALLLTTRFVAADSSREVCPGRSLKPSAFPTGGLGRAGRCDAIQPPTLGANRTRYRMLNPTKYCELVIVMKSGERLRGKYHVPLGTADGTRPADALRKDTNGFILLCDVTFLGESESAGQQAVLVRADAISIIELPEPQWDIRDVDPAAEANRRPTSSSSSYAV